MAGVRRWSSRTSEGGVSADPAPREGGVAAHLREQGRSQGPRAARSASRTVRRCLGPRAARSADEACGAGARARLRAAIGRSTAAAPPWLPPWSRRGGVGGAAGPRRRAGEHGDGRRRSMGRPPWPPPRGHRGGVGARSVRRRCRAGAGEHNDEEEGGDWWKVKKEWERMTSRPHTWVVRMKKRYEGGWIRNK
jgi:hypothetical protein